ncbi:MAG: LLM class flavin-dependent oxidoreductase [Candidatus Dormibacteraeota bacterium]|uniref:LLM class flavin-dependent oxidoreductase n=1 Tax=Candidatus Dormiibacter inghamiae TaxID=3127013 RepID=A0A934N6Z1_9BACT|nr:LLM class flavin-dependent oxidoreductase [Candidatus Dormibacteraeota bacterium]
MRFGAHLPIAGFSHQLPEAGAIARYAEAAEALGYTTTCANDHLLFSVPWVDGLIALGVAAGRTSRIRLITTAALLAVRGAGPLGSALAALQHLGDGRLTAAVTPGSTRADYEAVEADFDSRWSRFEREMPRLRDFLLRMLADAAPPIWIASWGSRAGLRRVARLGDGWLASAYHGTPEHISDCTAYLRGSLVGVGKDPAGFPLALATMYLYISEDRAELRSVGDLVRSPAVASADLGDRLLIGTVDECVGRLQRLEAAGIREVFVWPLRDEVAQLELFIEEVGGRLG